MYAIRSYYVRWEDKFKPKTFMNYVYLDENKNIVSSDIKDEIEEDFILKIANNDNFSTLTSYNFV